MYQRAMEGGYSGRKMWLIMKGWEGRVVKVCFYHLSSPYIASEAGIMLIGGNTVCCIYHAPKPIDESSDESSSDSDDSESDSGDDGGARPARGGGAHGHGDGHDHNHGGKGKGKPRARSPNAYEKIPKPRGCGGGVVKKG